MKVLFNSPPNTAYVVHIVSQFISIPRSSHYSTDLRILHHIKETIFHGLHISTNSSWSYPDTSMPIGLMI
ncbi:hypothetical protein CR513_34399, partial [Mucuna pruriens]